MQRVPNIPADVQLWIMLEVLLGIPEEAQVIHTSVKRVTLRGELGKRVPLVLRTVETFLKQQMNAPEWDIDGQGNMLRAIKCVSVWIRWASQRNMTRYTYLLVKFYAGTSATLLRNASVFAVCFCSWLTNVIGPAYNCFVKPVLLTCFCSRLPTVLGCLFFHNKLTSSNERIINMNLTCKVI